MAQEGKQVRVVLTVILPAAQKRELVYGALMVNLPKAQKRKHARRVLMAISQRIRNESSGRL